MKQVELIEKRRPREKHFLQEDGTIVAELYNDDVHFLKEGKYESIDNTLIKRNGYFINKKNAYKAIFDLETSNRIMKMQNENNYIEFKLVNGNIVSANKNRENDKLYENITYENILNSIDLKYELLPTKVKETIIIKDNINVPKIISFIVKTNLVLQLNNNGSIDATTDNKLVFTIDIPFMVDNNGVVNKNLSYELIKTGNDYTLNLILDDVWLKNEKTSYPVFVDPTITNDTQNSDAYDTYIYLNDTNDTTRYNDDILYAGVNKDINDNPVVYRSLLWFDLPKLGTGSQVVNATLILYGFAVPWYDYDTDLVDVHRITTPWTESGANWSTMNNQYDHKVETSFYNQKSHMDMDYETLTLEANRVNLTNLVKRWYGDLENNGIMLKQHIEEYRNDRCPAFFSKDNSIIGANPKPLLQISYINQNGLESYMNQQYQNFSQGFSVVNNYTGNMTSIFDLDSILGDNTGVTLKLVYNTNDVVLEKNYGLGIGYKFNLLQTVSESNLSNYLEYLDADGTKHYFLKNGDEYFSEDFAGLSIVKDNLDYILKKDGSPISKFEKHSDNVYYMVETNMSSDDIIEINYTDNLISNISINNNQNISITYNSNNIVVVANSRTTTLNINNGKITSMVKSTGSTQFSYNNLSLITSIIDENGTSKQYEYYDISPFRIKKIKLLGLNNQIIDVIEMKYGNNYTMIENNSGNVHSISFDNLGRPISVTNLSEELDLGSAYGIRETFGEAGGSKNKVLSVGYPIKYVKNYLEDASFENDSLQFTCPSGVTLSICDTTSHSGIKSLKMISSNNNDYVYKEINESKGKDYTFSAYLKSNKRIKLSMSYVNQNNEIIEVFSDKVVSEYKFERTDVSIHYPSTALSSLILKIHMEEPGTGYIDDIQLEDGLVANDYNLIDNSDFGKNLSGWDISATSHEIDNPNPVNENDYFSVVTVSGNQKAVKIQMDPIIDTSLSKTINMSGHAGDLFNVSFWYKNEGITPSSSDVANSVIMNFYNDLPYNPGNPDELIEDPNYYGHCVLPSTPLNSNSDNWQYFSYNFVAEYDYSRISLAFFQMFNDNDLYITNICLFKDVREAGYNYNDGGNVTLECGLNENTIKYTYNQDSSLSSISSSDKKEIEIEYLDELNGKPYHAIDNYGISHETKYDVADRPLYTSNKYVGNDEINGQYYIRAAGTDKYVNVLSDRIILGSYNKAVWTIPKFGDKYGLKFSIITDGYVDLEDNALKLTDNLHYDWILEKQDNGSYMFKYDENSNLYLKHYSDIIILDEYNSDNKISYEFYLEEFASDKELFLESGATYDENGYTKELTDSLLGEKRYIVNSNTGLIQKSINGRNVEKNYIYNNKKLIDSVEIGDRSVSYQYNNNNSLSKIICSNKSYNFEYDNYLNISSFKIGNVPLVNTTYDTNGNILGISYGNNQSINLTYDNFNRKKTVAKYDKTYEYFYNNNGNLAKIVSSNLEKKYTYDLSKKLNEYKENNFKIKYSYNSKNYLLGKKYILDTTIKSVDNFYNLNDQLVGSTYSYGITSYRYDYLNRPIKLILGNNYNVEYSYLTNGKRTSNLINKINYNNSFTIGYKFDKMRNVSHVYSNGILEKKYTYDEHNQLIREDDYINNQTIRYYYDLNGNILRKKYYNLNSFELIDIVKYEYNDLTWLDKLTSFNGQTITYDNIGNPVSVGANITLNWINGRELATYNDSSKNLTVSYKYDEDSNRIEKNVNNVITNYYLEDGRIIFEKRNNQIIYYMYDLMDNVIGFELNGTAYYYLKNLLNDIIAIVDGNGTIICNYTYDSFGKMISIKDGSGNDISSNSNHVGNLNPFRYKSYYYDTETNLYYLKTRYYNPETGRFINADGFVDSNDLVLGYNLYIYANNNHINYIDSDGQFGLGAAFLVGAGLGALSVLVADGVKSAVTGKLQFSSWQTYAGAALGGGLSAVTLGALGSAGCAIATNAFAAGAITGAITYTTTAAINAATDNKPNSFGDYFNVKDFAVSTIAGGVGNYVTGKVFNVDGITKGRGSYSAVYRATVKKIANGNASNMSTKVIVKGTINNNIGDIPLNMIKGLFAVNTLEDPEINAYKNDFQSYYSVPALPKYDWDTAKMCYLSD